MKRNTWLASKEFDQWEVSHLLHPTQASRSGVEVGYLLAFEVLQPKRREHKVSIESWPFFGFWVQPCVPNVFAKNRGRTLLFEPSRNHPPKGVWARRSRVLSRGTQKKNTPNITPDSCAFLWPHLKKFLSPCWWRHDALTHVLCTCASCPYPSKFIPTHAHQNFRADQIRHFVDSLGDAIT